MQLDEQLLEIKAKEKKRRKEEEKKNEMIEQLKEEERQRKTVEEYKQELEEGIVSIRGKQYPCEKKDIFENSLTLFLFSKTAKEIKETKELITILYEELELSFNLFQTKDPMIITTPEEYQDRIKIQMREQEMDYYPMDCGGIQREDRTIFYAKGMIPVAIGSIMGINFCFPKEEGTIIGNFTFKLLEKYQLENLSMAMLELM